MKLSCVVTSSLIHTLVCISDSLEDCRHFAEKKESYIFCKRNVVESFILIPPHTHFIVFKRVSVSS